MNQQVTTHPYTARSVVVPGLIATVLAAVATTAIAVVAIKAGVSFVALNDPAKKPIPPQGFAVLTVGFSLVGVVLALILAKTARHPRKVFLITTLVLLALSLVPDFTDVIAVWPTQTKFALALTHLVAAAIVIPAVARRLAP